jgi:RsiW-degrading membrane proteinase PrsW (M82 family)
VTVAAVMILLIGLLPVLCFLGALVALDSYKLVGLLTVVALIACGAAAAVGSYFANEAVLGLIDIDLQHFARYGSPVIEEALKGSIVVVLIRTRRIGFLIDAAILGFAVGAGFALVENGYIFLLHLIPYTGVATWIVRGFGTAIMHGGTTAIFAVLGLTLIERRPGALLRPLAPGFAIAVLLHSAFNHAILAPLRMTIAILLFLPPLFYAVFNYCGRGVRDWLGRGFDADTEMLDLINSGRLSDSPVGAYLKTLKERFGGPIVADILCYLRLYTELGLRAKGILMMRENGFDVPADEPTRAKFAEMEYLEGTIGRTGLLAIAPMLRISQAELQQIYMLGRVGHSQ